MIRLQNNYKNIISYDLITKFNYKNSFELPDIQDISINLSSISLANEKKKIISLLLAIELITGQKGKIITSKKNKIHLKIKEGMVVGCKVTLNKKNSYLFLDTLITMVLPNLNDFKGFHFNKKSKSILSFSIENLLHFPELRDEFLNFSNLPPINVTIRTTSKKLEESRILLNSFNFPIRK